MKKFLYLFFLIGFMSCEDVIELETPTGEVRLNVDAHFRVFTAENPVRYEGEIILTETANFFAENIPTVSNANVYISERGTTNTYNFVENEPESGRYQIQDMSFLNNSEAIFDLRIEVNEDVYIANARLIPTSEILNLSQGDLEIFGEEDFELRVAIDDDAELENYYLMDFGFNLYETIDDRFFNGNPFEFSYLYTEDDEADFEPGDILTIVNDGIDEQFYTYMELLLEQADGTDVFSSPPAILRGNIINENNPDKYPLGYFRISESFALDYEVLEEE